MSDGLMTAREAAAYLRVGKSTLHQMVRNHGLRCFRTPGGDTRFRLDWLDQFVEENSRVQRSGGRPRKGVS